MLLSTLLAAALVSGGDPLVKTTIVSASLFKNGYSVVVREAPISSTGETLIGDLPQSVLGTLWITASPGVKLKSVVVTNLTAEQERSAESLDEILSANVGKELSLMTSDKGIVMGRLLSASGYIAVIDRIGEDGKKLGMAAISKASVLQISSRGSELVWSIKKQSTTRAMRLSADKGQKGSIFIVSLERGLTWAPGYSLDITDPKKVKMIAKATIMNDLADLKNLELRLVTGFPNIPYLNLFDPLTTQQSLNDWANQLMQAGTPTQLRASGGFGGQMAQNSAGIRMGEFDQAFDPNTLQGVQAEDLFFYRQPNVTLDRGDRGYWVLLTMESDYEHIYEWEVDDMIRDDRYYSPQPNQPQQPDDVWHSIRFKNTANQPLTTASAVTIKNGEILGQDMMKYTSVGAEASVKITKALDVKAEDAEEEVARERESLKLRSGYYDLVTLKGKLLVVNRKAEPVKLEITKSLTGEIKSADGKPVITTQAKGLRAVNPKQKLRWTVTITPGGKVELNYTYSVYVSG